MYGNASVMLTSSEEVTQLLLKLTVKSQSSILRVSTAITSEWKQCIIIEKTCYAFADIILSPLYNMRSISLLRYWYAKNIGLIPKPLQCVVVGLLTPYCNSVTFIADLQPSSSLWENTRRPWKLMSRCYNRVQIMCLLLLVQDRHSCHWPGTLSLSSSTVERWITVKRQRNTWQGKEIMWNVNNILCAFCIFSLIWSW